MRGALLLAAAALAACKTEPKTAPAASSAPGSAVAPAAPPAPAAPAAPPKLTYARIAEATPLMPDAVVLEGLTVDADGVGHWKYCLPGAEEHATAIGLSKLLFKGGWQLDESRGDPTKAGIDGTKDGVGIHVLLGEQQAKCTVATATFVSAGQTPR